MLFATENEYCMIASKEIGSEFSIRRSGKADGRTSTVLGVKELECAGELKKIVLLRNVFEAVEGCEILSKKSHEWK